jgi:hypothetical protein
VTLTLAAAASPPAILVEVVQPENRFQASGTTRAERSAAGTFDALLSCPFVGRGFARIRDAAHPDGPLLAEIAVLCGPGHPGPLGDYPPEAPAPSAADADHFRAFAVLSTPADQPMVPAVLPGRVEFTQAHGAGHSTDRKHYESGGGAESLDTEGTIHCEYDDVQ